MRCKMTGDDQVIVTANTTIYIVTRASDNLAESKACRRLAACLRTLGRDARLYISTKEHCSNNLNNYDDFGVPVDNSIVDHNENIVIITETELHLLNNLKNAQKAVWWLTVDNFYYYCKLFISDMPDENIIDSMYFIYNDSGDITHLASCEYTRLHLLLFSIREKAVKPLRALPEPINSSAAEEALNTERNENIVLYNKDYRDNYIDSIISHYEKTRHPKDALIFIPVADMDAKMRRQVYKTAKVFIDFGAHIGLSQELQEAAAYGCCVITSLRGSAKYDEDLPIPAEYKIETVKENIEKTIDIIITCARDYNLRKSDFNRLREFINGEEQRFTDDIKDLFSLTV